MAKLKVSELQRATSLNSTDLVYVVQSNVSKAVTIQNLLGSINGNVNSVNGGYADNRIIRYDGTSGANIQGSLVTISDTGAITAPNNTGSIIPFYYANVASFPPAANSHGALAHGHATGKMYYAHGGVWIEMANLTEVTAGGQGATGATGTAGTVGSTGATGTAGATGATGATGTVGSTGAAGATGTVGTIGSTGATGTVGTIGSTGATGTVGTIGSTGATGVASTVPGPTGATGAAGNGMGNVNSVNAGYVDNAVTRYDGTAGTNIQNSLVTIADDGAIVAPQASSIIPFYYAQVTDFPSSTTYHGAVAHAHSTGKLYYAHSGWNELANMTDIAAGPTGATGATGSIGATGTAGTVGSTGATGTAGTIGSTGATGTAGTIGSTGATGATGAASTVSGPTGATGTAGATGVTGASASISFSISASGSADYVFSGPGIVSGNTNDPVLYLYRGFTYTFVNTTGAGHPFAIRVSNGGSAYTTGVSGSQTGTQTFEVPMNAPSTLYYQCTLHGGMGNTINIV